MNAQSPLLRADLASWRMPSRSMVVAANASQAGFYGWLLGWLVVVMAVACIRLTLMS